MSFPLILSGSYASKLNGFDTTNSASDVDLIFAGSNGDAEKFLELPEFVRSWSADKRWTGKYHGILSSGVRFELETADPWSSNSLLWDYLRRTPNYRVGTKLMVGEAVGNPRDQVLPEFVIPDLHTLYLIKRSHAHRSQNWVKTMAWLGAFRNRYPSIQTLDYNGVEEDHFQFYQTRRDEADYRHGVKEGWKANLNVTNDRFFAPSQHLRVYDHDSLHRLVAFLDRPMYAYAKRDPEKALVSQKMFNDLPWQHKFYMAQEEIMVVALERFYIPFKCEKGVKMSYMEAYKRGYQKLVTTMTSGWFNDFLIDFFNSLKMPFKPEFIEIFERAVEDGTLKLMREDRHHG
jgi:hypothetical protein